MDGDDRALYSLHRASISALIRRAQQHDPSYDAGSLLTFVQSGPRTADPPLSLGHQTPVPGMNFLAAKLAQVDLDGEPPLAGQAGFLDAEWTPEDLDGEIARLQGLGPLEAEALQAVLDVGAPGRGHRAVLLPRLAHPPNLVMARNPLSSRQGYLDPAPKGIDAAAAWARPGGNGEGCRFASVEQGWTVHHEELQGMHFTHLFGRNGRFREHGANTLGVVLARDNRQAGVGVAHGVNDVLLCSEDTGEGTAETANAMLAALPALGPGDVLLVESQMPLLGSMAPVESHDMAFEVIRLATAMGVTVVEPAGNGGRNLDGLVAPTSRVAAFNRGVRDSGAVLVGAATARVPHRRLGFSNYGSAVDCYAWGEYVVTVGGDPGNGTRNAYNFNYSGTSAAAAIIAGVALVLQGIARRSDCGPLRPRELRRILGDRSYGTPSARPGADRIGVMPDLRKVLFAPELGSKFRRRKR